MPCSGTERQRERIFGKMECRRLGHERIENMDRTMLGDCRNPELIPNIYNLTDCKVEIPIVEPFKRFQS